MIDLTETLEEARSYAALSYAKNTRIAYASDWKQFKEWCTAHQREPLPASVETILGYIVALSKRLCVASIDRRLCGIAFYHQQERVESPIDDPEVVVTMRGLRRAKGMLPAAKEPISTTLLQQLVAELGRNLRDQQGRAVLLLGFAGAFRRSELVALQVRDLAFVPEGLIITVRRSKTDQEGQGFYKGIPKGLHLATCPVAATQAWLKAAAITEGHIFRVFNSREMPTERPMPSYEVARVVKRLVQRVGLDPELYGGHSLRSGLVTAAAQAGVEERVIMQQTGHASPRTLRRYIRHGSLFRENAAAHVGL